MRTHENASILVTRLVPVRARFTEEIMNYKERREALAHQLPCRSVAIIANPMPKRRSGDQDYPYRPDSNMIYLTGMDEAGAIAVISSSEQDVRFRLFVLKRDPNLERWTGPRYGVEGSIEKFGADEAFPIDELDQKLKDIFLPLDEVFFDFSYAPELASKFFEITESLRHRGRHSAEGPRRFSDIRDIVGEMRRVKDADEIEVLKRAAHISAEGFKNVLKMLKPGVGEWEVEATLKHAFRVNGAMGESFGSICAGGAHATTLHYEANCDVLNKGDLILIDAGAEVDYYAGDISRTFPVDGIFTPAQRDIYALVLEAQKAGIEACRAGNHMKSSHEAVRRVFAEGLHRLHICAESPEEILEKNIDFEFYFHGTSHYLGIDTHDVGVSYKRGGKDTPARLEPGVVITVEPGLYFTLDDERIPEKYRGIGVRIEDDVLVTDGDPVVLTAELVKEIDDIEAFMRNP